MIKYLTKARRLRVRGCSIFLQRRCCTAAAPVKERRVSGGKLCKDSLLSADPRLQKRTTSPIQRTQTSVLHAAASKSCLRRRRPLITLGEGLFFIKVIKLSERIKKILNYDFKLLHVAAEAAPARCRRLREHERAVKTEMSNKRRQGANRWLPKAPTSILCWRIDPRSETSHSVFNGDFLRAETVPDISHHSEGHQVFPPAPPQHPP